MQNKLTSTGTAANSFMHFTAFVIDIAFWQFIVRLLLLLLLLVDSPLTLSAHPPHTPSYKHRSSSSGDWRTGGAAAAAASGVDDVLLCILKCDGGDTLYPRVVASSLWATRLAGNGDNQLD